jgi:hypothetical protein
MFTQIWDWDEIGFIGKLRKKYCNLSIRTDPRSVWTASLQMERFARPNGPSENSRITFRTRKT